MSKSEAGRDDKKVPDDEEIKAALIAYEAAVYEDNSDEESIEPARDALLAVLVRCRDAARSADTPPSAGAATFAPEMREALAGTASLLEDFAKVVKAPPGQGYTDPRTIEVAVWDHCEAGGEAVESMVLEDGEAEAIAKLIREALSVPSSAAPLRQDVPGLHC